LHLNPQSSEMKKLVLKSIKSVILIQQYFCFRVLLS